MGIDTAMALAALGLVLLIPLHQQLTIRALRYALARQREQLHQHHRAIVQLQSAAVVPPTSVGQPMPAVTGAHRAIGGPVRPPALWVRENGPGPSAGGADDTLRLQRPPALTDLQHVLTQAGRALTVTEMAAQLGRQTWDLLPDIDRDMAAGRIRTVPGHTAGRTAYQLADSTERMPNGMPLLPGTVARA